MAEDRTDIVLSVIDRSGPQPVLHIRCWQILPHLAAVFAEEMSARWGEPNEMFGDPVALEKAAVRSAAEDGTVYMDSLEQGRD